MWTAAGRQVQSIATLHRRIITRGQIVRTLSYFFTISWATWIEVYSTFVAGHCLPFRLPLSPSLPLPRPLWLLPLWYICIISSMADHSQPRLRTKRAGRWTPGNGDSGDHQSRWLEKKKNQKQNRTRDWDGTGENTRLCVIWFREKQKNKNNPCGNWNPHHIVVIVGRR